MKLRYIFVAVVLLSAATAGFGVEGINEISPGSSVSASGIRWVIVWTLALVSLSGPRLKRAVLPGVPYLIGFCVWVAIRWAMQGFSTVGAKDVFFYSLVPVFSVYSATLLGKAQRQVGACLVLASLVPFFILSLDFMTGQLQLTDVGPQGHLAVRPAAIFLNTSLAYLLMSARYSPHSSMQLLYKTVALLVFGTILFTLSRMASLVAVLSLGIVMVGLERLTRAMIGGVLASVVLLVLVATILGDSTTRFFHRPVYSLGEVRENLNVMGRDKMWEVAAEGIREAPVLGHGPGTARLEVGRAVALGRGIEYHPHNEYLQVVHDVGILGLALFLAGWWRLGVYHWLTFSRSIHSGTSEGAKWHGAALLCMGAVLITALTDNTWHYAYVTVPTMIISGVASGVSSATLQLNPMRRLNFHLQASPRRF